MMIHKRLRSKIGKNGIHQIKLIILFLNNQIYKIPMLLQKIRHYDKQLYSNSNEIIIIVNFKLKTDAI